MLNLIIIPLEACVRFLICLILATLFAPFAQADEFYDYIQVHCDPQQRIFEVRNITMGRKITEEDVDTPGKIYGKRERIEWTESANGNVITVKKDLLDIPSCTIEESHTNSVSVETNIPIEFKVIRASIDQGNVQGRCGAALGARFVVTVNGVEMANYPSKKEQCFRNDGPTHISKVHNVSYSPFYGLKHCEYPNFKTSVLPGHSLKSNVTICWRGKANEYLEYLEYRDTVPDDKDNPDVMTEVLKMQQRDANRSLYYMTQATKTELAGTEMKNEELTDALEALTDENKRLEKERNQLQGQLQAQLNKSFWQRILNK